MPQICTLLDGRPITVDFRTQVQGGKGVSVGWGRKNGSLLMLVTRVDTEFLRYEWGIALAGLCLWGRWWYVCGGMDGGSARGIGAPSRMARGVGGENDEAGAGWLWPQS